MTEARAATPDRAGPEFAASTSADAEPADAGPELTWLYRMPIVRMWTLWFALHLAIGAHVQQARPFRWQGTDHVAPVWLIAGELSVRWASVWCLILVASRALARRIPAAGWRAASGAVASGLLLGCAAVAILNLVPCVVLPWGLCSPGRPWLALRLMAVTEWLFVTVPMVLAWLVAREAGRYRADQIRAHRMQRALSRSQAAALRSQLRPHFLFNTLQSVATLMHRDVAAADRMLLGVRRLLQSSLDLDSSEQITLATELELLRQYTGIEVIRFGGNLEVVTFVEPRAESAQVPQLLLQPLVENSVQHAFGRRGRGRVEISATVDRRGEWLTLEVRDDGDGSGSGAGDHFGLGLTNTRARLESLYGGRHEFVFEPRAGAGTTVRLRLPYTTGS